MSVDVEKLRALLAAATPGEWTPMRDGNQYVNTAYLPTAKCVGATRIEGPQRPWNPHAYVAFGFRPHEFETVRFTDADADLVCALVNAAPQLLAIAEAAEKYYRACEDVSNDSADRGFACDRLFAALAAVDAARKAGS